MGILQGKRRYVEVLWTLLKNCMPKDSDPMESLSADDLIRHDAKQPIRRLSLVRWGLIPHGRGRIGRSQAQNAIPLNMSLRKCLKIWWS